MILKHAFKTLFLLLAFGILFSCSSDDGPGATPADQPQLILTASTMETTTGEEISFQVSVEGEVISDVEIFVNDIGISGDTHVFEEVGTYAVVAKKEGYTDSEPVHINVSRNLRLKTFTEEIHETNLSYNDDNFLVNWQTDSSNNDVVYDSEGRVIKNAWWNFTYNSSGQLVKMTETDDAVIINKEANFIYNNAGLPVRCNYKYTYSSSGNTIYFERTFEYNENHQLVSITEHEPGKSYYRFLLSYDARGNISEVKRENSMDGTNFTLQITETFTYDNQKNPRTATLNRMGVSSPQSFVYLSMMNGEPSLGNNTFFQLFYYNPNNILTATQQSSAGLNSKTYTYVYNEEGYPTSVEESTHYHNGTTNTIYRSWFYETY